MVMLNKEERGKVLEKLAKLFAHTGDGAVNVNEMEIANRKIKELTDEYGISLEEIRAANGEDKEKLIEMVDVNLYNDNPAMWSRTMAVIISEFYECKAVRSKGIIHFIGFSLDAEVASEVFNRLYYIIWATARMQASHKNDFCYGVVIALRERLEDIRIAREKVSNVTALVVVKKEMVVKEVTKIFPKLIQGNSGKYRKSEDFYKGVAYGKRVEIFKSVTDDNSVKKNESVKVFEKKVFKIRKK